MSTRPTSLRSRSLGVAALATFALVAAACGGGDSGDSGALKIGFAADLGELGAFSDQPGSEAAEVAVAAINAAGGVCGKPVEYIVKDIQGDPAATQRAARSCSMPVSTPSSARPSPTPAPRSSTPSPARRQ